MRSLLRHIVFCFVLAHLWLAPQAQISLAEAVILVIDPRVKPEEDEIEGRTLTLVNEEKSKAAGA